MPLGEIIHSYDQDVVALWNANFDEGLKIAKATGAKEMLVGTRQHADHPPDGRHHHGHGGGATRWSTATARPTKSRTCTWQAPASSPTAGASNPTYTIFALSLRGAEQLATKWSTVAG